MGLLSPFKRQERSHMALNLTTRADYKTYANIKSTNEDGIIDFLLPKVSQLVKTYCRRTFVDYMDEDKVEIFTGGYDTLILSETPVVSIASVQYSADYGQTYTALTEYTDWVLDSDKILSLATDGFKRAPKGYKVTYRAGYDDVPNDIELAVLDLISYYRRNDGAIHSAKAPGSNSVQIEYISTTSLPAHIRRVLDQYVADYT
jgi:hypothetical protein